ncbi:DUF6192 family protein [Streptomyces sp. 11x1]|uniref:DUF6192 family protein n=1 Tax=Streptomyces sp. 11x1 TaxID=3038642 RepID=UPI0037DA660D
MNVLVHPPNDSVEALAQLRSQRHCLDRHTDEQNSAPGRTPGLNRSQQPRQILSPARPAYSDTRPAQDSELLGTEAQKHARRRTKTVPQLRDRQLTGDEQAVLAQNVARCRAVLDWIETTAETGKVDMDEKPARLLRSE